MREIIKIAPNGQWSLEKAVNFPKHRVKDSVYEATNLNNQKQLLTNEDLQASHDDLLSYYKENNLPIEDMVNELTGETEPHVLVERGIHDESSWEPDAKINNKLDWSTHPGYVTSDHHSVVAASDASIAGDDGRQPGYIDGGGKAVHLKFWAPLSSVVGRRSHLGQYLGREGLDGEEYDAAGFDNHILLRPGKFPVHSKTNWRWTSNAIDGKYSGMKRLATHVPDKGGAE